MKTRIILILLLVVLMLTAISCSGDGGSNSIEAQPCPDVVCLLARMLDTNPNPDVDDDDLVRAIK